MSLGFGFDIYNYAFPEILRTQQYAQLPKYNASERTYLPNCKNFIVEAAD